MANPLTLPQNGLKVGDQIIAEGDSVSLGNNVGVKNNLTVGGTLYANKVSSPFVSKTHTTNSNLIIDCNYTQHAITLTANPTGITFTNVPAATEGNYTVTVYLQQDVKGNRLFNWSNNTNLLWPNLGYVANNPVYPTLQTAPYKLDIFTFITFNGGTTWIAYQQNPVAPQNTDLINLQYALQSYNNLPGVAANSSAYSGSVVQIKQQLNTNILTFGSSSSTPIDICNMTFYPKYQTSRLILMGCFTTSSSGSYPADFSVRGYFTVGTTPIQNGLLLGNASNQFYYDVYPNQSDRQQVAHFGGYFYAMNSNMHLTRHSQTYYDHNVSPGTAIDLRIRVVHADAWSARSCCVGTSWTGTSNGQGSYTNQVPTSLTVMEVIV